MPATSAAPVTCAPSPRLALAAQAAVLALVIAVAERAPRPGLAAWYLPLFPARHHAALDWALAHGAALNGKGPFGGLIVIAPPHGLGARALYEGALVISIPSILCQPQEVPPHG